MSYNIKSGVVSTGITLSLWDYMYISSGGIASNTTIDDEGCMYISGGGVAKSTTVNRDGYMAVSSGGVASNTTVNSGGHMTIASGGTALSIKENGGYVDVADGAGVTFVSNTFTGITLSYESMTVHQNTVANNTILNDGGSMHISSGGVANDTTVNSGGRMHISSGGAANNTTVKDWGSMYISSGGMANRTTVNSGGTMYISSGGVANSTTVSRYGSIYIEDGGVANSTTLDRYGSIYIEDGCVANNTTVNQYGYMVISSGGMASNTTVNRYGYIAICSGGTALAIKENGGYVDVADGADVNFASNTISGLVVSGGMTVHSNTVANNTTVNRNGSMTIFSGGTANNTTLVNYGSICILSGGTANNTDVSSNCDMWISSGGTANFTTINSGGDITISSGVVANSTTVNAGGRMAIYAGGTALDIVENGGEVILWDGADVTFASNTITGLVINSAHMTVHENTVANSTTLNFDGNMDIYHGGVANSTTVNSGGYMRITSGGVANNTTVNSDGGVHISSGGVTSNTTLNGGFIALDGSGVANNTTVNSDGGVYISSSGVASNTIVNSGGEIRISSDGVHRGSLAIADGAVVSAYDGSIIDFTVAGRTVADNYLINDLSLISGAPTYTITVSTEQAYGTYKLAQGASSFTGTISIGDGTTAYGSLTVNGENLVYNGMSYSLDQIGGNLLLEIAEGPAVFIYSSGTLTSSGRQITGAELQYGGNNAMHISSGGVANSTTMNSGDMYISSGGVANSTTMDGGWMEIFSGGVANSTTVSEYGEMHISSGGVANSTTVNYSGYMCISSGGVASSTILNDGYISIEDGGVANNTTLNGESMRWDEFSEMHISKGGVANNTIVNSGASVFIAYGSEINNIVANGGVIQYGDWEDSGEVLGDNTITIQTNSIIQFSSNEVMAKTSFVIAKGARVFSYNIAGAGGDAYYSGSMYGTVTVKGIFIVEDAVPVRYALNSLTVDDGGVTYLITPEKIQNITVKAGGNLYVAMTAHADGVTIDGGAVHVATGGMVSNVTISNNGKLFLYGGAILDGVINVNGTMVLDDLAVNNGTINLVLNEEANKTAMINNLAFLDGGDYSVSVDNAGTGEYLLAGQAYDFDSSITIQNSDGELGSLQLGGTIEHNNMSYSLTNNGGNLALQVTSVVESPDVPDTPDVPAIAEPVTPGASVEFNAESVTVDISVGNKVLNIADLTGEGVNIYAPRVEFGYSVGEAAGNVDKQVTDAESVLVKAETDEMLDLFMANATGVWSSKYVAKHTGSANGWASGEKVELAGKNKITDFFYGAEDDNILYLTDDSNGDALFVDDVYSAIPGNDLKNKSRIENLKVVYAGSGDDVVDMTSSKFAYVGNGVKIYGGSGNDTIWANNGENTLFGDSGNDRIVGGSDNDVIVGGIGNDRLHGGGGVDTFCFGENWGRDTVEQLTDGEVILWFESGSTANWDEDTLTYTDGKNTVTVTGVTADKITLKFGDNASVRYDELAESGCFEDSMSEKIFEEKNKGYLA